MQRGLERAQEIAPFPQTFKQADICWIRPEVKQIWDALTHASVSRRDKRIDKNAADALQVLMLSRKVSRSKKDGQVVAAASQTCRQLIWSATHRLSSIFSNFALLYKLHMELLYHKYQVTSAARERLTSQVFPATNLANFPRYTCARLAFFLSTCSNVAFAEQLCSIEKHNCTQRHKCTQRQDDTQRSS